MFMYMLQGEVTSPTIRLCDGADKRLKTEFELANDVALAAHVGVDQGQLSRVKNKRSKPGPEFIARFLLAAGVLDLDFYDLFEVVPNEPTEA